MARRFAQFYQCKRLDNLGDPEWHNRRWDDIDRRVHARELDSTAIDVAVADIQAVALARLNDTFTPLIERAVQQLTSVGVLFSAHAASEQAISAGGKSWTVDPADRVGFVVSDYVSAHPVGMADRGMICSVDSWDATTGVLRATALEGYVTGSGTYDSWELRVSVTPNLDSYTRAEVDDRIGAIIDGAPAALNTLRKLADALGDDPNVVTSLLSTTLVRANNLSDLASPATARANLGLGSVDNTRDLDKPVSSLQRDAIEAVRVASGTQMLFYQANAPVGWVRRTDLSNRALRVADNGGTIGGVLGFSSAFAYRNADYTTLDGNTLPSHYHSISDPWHAHSNDYAAYNGAYGGTGVQNAAIGSTASTNGAPTGIGIYNAGGSWGHTHGYDMRVAYCDVIVCTKS